MKKIEPGTGCPLDGFKKCREHRCAWYMQVRGANPNTGEPMDHWGCAIAWLPILTIENSQQQRQTGAAVESLRNELVRTAEVGHRVLLAAVTNEVPAPVLPRHVPNGHQPPTLEG